MRRRSRSIARPTGASYRPPAVLPARGRCLALLAPALQVVAGEPLLDERPPSGKPAVARRQDPDAVKVVGKQDGREHRERPFGLDRLDGLAKGGPAEVGG